MLKLIQVRYLAIAAVGWIGIARAQHDPENYVYSQHSFSHPYTEDGFRIPHWDYQGDTAVMDKVIRLTPDRQSRKGNLWNTVPWNPATPDADFEIHLDFHVNGQGTSLYGDGFAVWYTAGIRPLGNVFGSDDKWIGMGVMFDTYSNMKGGHSQYISVILGDGETAYEHDKDGGDAKIAGCAVDFRGKRMEARIVYAGNMLRMYTAQLDSPWEECFVVRKVRLNKGYHFGISAATGDLADNHDIHSFKVSDPQPMSPEELADLMQRIERDVADGVEEQEHHDPQYENDGNTVGKPIPIAYSLAAIFAVVVAVLVFVWYTQRTKQYHAKHFT
eukprot:m.137986 g.137986  ORF g.137986 m.137986 type:complete len:330 (-) comp17591_c0_seq1:133-1122(-)